MVNDSIATFTYMHFTVQNLFYMTYVQILLYPLFNTNISSAATLELYFCSASAYIYIYIYIVSGV